MGLGSRLHLPFWGSTIVFLIIFVIIIIYFNFYAWIICLLVNSFMIAVLPQLSVKKEKMHQEDLEAYIFLSGNKLLCSSTAILHHFIQQGSLTQTLKKQSCGLFLKILLICPSPLGNFAENCVLKLVEPFAVFGKAFRIAAQGQSPWLLGGRMRDCFTGDIVI